MEAAELCQKIVSYDGGGGDDDDVGKGDRCDNDCDDDSDNI